MAFVLTLGLEFVPPYIGQEGSSRLILLPIGYDDTEDRSYFLSVTFDVLPGGLQEFAFCIVEHDGETDSEYQYWNSSDVSQFITKRDRDLIRAGLLAITRYLVNDVRPQEVSMCTADGELPEQAIIKFLLICDVFRSCGYTVSHYDEYHGQRVWRMVRDEATEV